MVEVHLHVGPRCIRRPCLHLLLTQQLAAPAVVGGKGGKGGRQGRSHSSWRQLQLCEEGQGRDGEVTQQLGASRKQRRGPKSRLLYDSKTRIAIALAACRLLSFQQPCLAQMPHLMHSTLWYHTAWCPHLHLIP